MIISQDFGDFTIELADDKLYSVNSTDNLFQYDKEYANEAIDSRGSYIAGTCGIKVFRNDKVFSSAIIFETGGATVVHEKSFCISKNNLLVCCCDKVYSLQLPGLELNWKARADYATCFQIYPFANDFIIHGELEICRIDSKGSKLWSFGGRDIFVTTDGSKSFEIKGHHIHLKNWGGDEYVLNEHGKLIDL